MAGGRLWVRLALGLLCLMIQSILAVDPTVILPNQCEDRQPRLEIRELAKNRDQWNIFLLGLKRMQEANYTDPTSYYALAGIHSWPNKGSEGVARCQGCSNQFCPHQSHLFAIWHRPYLALFERALRKHAIAAAEEFASGLTRRRQITAADTLRLPYWDWARPAAPGDNVFPSLFTNEKVMVQQSEGMVQIDNPLFQYDLGDAPTPGGPTSRQSTRYPVTDGVFQTSQNELAVQNMQKYRQFDDDDVKCGLYKVFYALHDMNTFSGTAGSGIERNVNSTWKSLEQIHDQIHTTIGGSDFYPNATYGTFFYLEVSAFDPVFWMHHAMVDRMLTMFQVINPDSWIRPQSTPSTWTIPQGPLIDGSVEMSPFFTSANGSMWTADSSRDAASFCYYYDDVDSQDSTKSEVLRVLNDVYSQGCLEAPPPPGAAAPTAPANNGSMTRLAVAPRAPKRQNVRTLLSLSQTVNNLVTKTGALRDYVANVKLDSMAIGDTVTVYLFDGQPNDNVASWESCPELLGKQIFLTTSSHGYGGSQPGTSKRASVTLTHALISRVEDGRLGGMGNNEVSWYLKQNLSWRVVKSDGCVLDNEQVPGFQVSVVTSDIQPPANRDELPVVTHAQVLVDVTAGKCGGLSSV